MAATSVLVRLSLIVLALLTIAGLPSCTRTEGETASRSDALPGVAATSGGSDASRRAGEGLGLDDVRARRLGTDTLRVTLRLVHDGVGPNPVPFDDRFATAPADAGSIADVYLSDPGGSRKYYVLRDDRDRPQCSIDQAPLEPGERRELWALFPAPPEGTSRISVHVPSLEFVADVPIEPAAQAMGSR